MRLKAIAADRAPTIAKVIHRICVAVGRPCAASTAPRKANGSAKSVCSILIISSVVPRLLKTFAIAYCALGEEPVVGTVSSDPKPDDSISFQGSDSAITARHSYGPNVFVAINALEVERGVK